MGRCVRCLRRMFRQHVAYNWLSRNSGANRRYCPKRQGISRVDRQGWKAFVFGNGTSTALRCRELHPKRAKLCDVSRRSDRDYRQNPLTRTEFRQTSVPSRAMLSIL